MFLGLGVRSQSRHHVKLNELGLRGSESSCDVEVEGDDCRGSRRGCTCKGDVVSDAFLKAHE